MLGSTILKVVVVFLAISSSTALTGQSRFSGGFGYVGLGSAKIENQGINQVHINNRYPSFAPASLLISGGGYGVIKGLLIGGEGGVVTPGSITGSGYSSTLTTGYGMIQLGIMPRIPFAGRIGQVFATIGVGRGITSYEVKEDFILLDYKGISEQLLMKVELNIISFPFTISNPDKSGGLLAGLSAGYLMNPQSQSIHSETQAFPYNPSIGPQPYTGGWYFTLKIGGGGLKRK